MGDDWMGDGWALSISLSPLIDRISDDRISGDQTTGSDLWSAGSHPLSFID
jgi:hypothetical protein